MNRFPISGGKGETLSHSLLDLICDKKSEKYFATLWEADHLSLGKGAGFVSRNHARSYCLPAFDAYHH